MSDENGRSKETSANRRPSSGREVEQAPVKRGAITAKQLAKHIANVNKDLNMKARSPEKENRDDAQISATPSNFGRSNVRYWEKTVEWIFVRNHFPGKAFAAPLASTAEEVGDAMLRFKDINSWCIIEFKDKRDSFDDEKTKYPAFGYSKWKKYYYSAHEKKLKNPENKELSDELKNWIKSEVEISIQEAKAPFGKLVDFWKEKHSVEGKKPPHVFVYGELSPPLEGLELKNVIEAIKGLEKGLQDNPLLEQVNVLSQWVGGRDMQNKLMDTFEIRGFSYWGKWFSTGPFLGKIPNGEPVSIADLRKKGWGFENFKKYVSAVIAAKRGIDFGAGDDGAADDKETWDFGTVLGITDDGQIATFSTYDFAIATEIVKTRNNKKDVAVQPSVPASKN